MASRPQRIQRKRVKGWRMPTGAVYVGRPTIWGNPFSAAMAVDVGYFHDLRDPRIPAFLNACFYDWMGDGPAGAMWWQGPESDRRKAAIRARLPELRGKNLVCWCRLDRICHADVLLELANGE